MLKLVDINKTYQVDKEVKVVALNSINLEFSDTGFVCILGQSGCGKTTMLNILGGLDNYTSGDLIINGQSTKDYQASSWDNYRNKEIGIVFQSYNLIPHLSVLGNVELALTLSGTNKKEREERAKEALISVGLEKEIYKKPNQLSGGQMQRVALARALVNKPNIILADEPTGALDSTTSIQVMDILKEISKTKLVITVTHNEELADKYASRIIRLKDGNVIEDTSFDNEKNEIVNDEVKKEEKVEVKKKEHTSMSFFTALSISGKNLLTKKKKTIITSVAASFGIIGVGLVLALSNGFSNYVNRMESETLSKFPLSIEKYSMESSETETEKLPKYPSDSTLNVVEPSTSNFHLNKINKDYVAYLEKIDKSKATLRYNYSVGMNVISSYKNDLGEYIYKHLVPSQTSFVQSLTSSISGTSTGWNEMSVSKEMVLDTYDVIYQKEGTSYPDEESADSKGGKQDQKEYGLILVVNSRNSLTTTLMNQIGLDPTSGKKYSFEEIANNIEYKYILPNDYYSQEKEIENKIGLFLKDEITYSQLSSALNSLTTEDFSSLLTVIQNYFDLPSDNQILQNSLISSIMSNSSDLSKYLNLDVLIDDITNNKLDINVTTGQINSYLKDNLKGSEREYNLNEFSKVIYKVLIDFLNDEDMKPYTNKSLKTYLEPTSNEEFKNLYSNENNRTLKINTILRAKEDTSLALLSPGIYYPKSLTYQALTDFGDSKIAKEFKNHLVVEPNQTNLVNTLKTVLVNIIDIDDQKLIDADLSKNIDPNKVGVDVNSYKITRANNDVNTLEKYSTVSDYLDSRLYLGSDVNTSSFAFTGTIDPSNYADYVSTITIYAKDYAAKGYIIDYLNKYNEDKSGINSIYYIDVGSLATDTVGQIVSVISAVLISFASISLVVSSIMIAIIIYTSVVERTKEIGILRSIGARKVDVGRLFKAEAVIIGFLSGVIGVVATYLISLPISLTLNNMFADVHLGQIAFLNPLHALLLIVISTVLTYIASLVPSLIASKKDPVTCLRSE